MLEDFDVVRLADGSYELVTGRSVIRVEFDDPTEKAMFDLVADSESKGALDTFRRLVQQHDKARVYAFFDKLKRGGLTYFENDEALAEGRVFTLADASKFRAETLSKSTIRIVSASSLAARLMDFAIFNDASLVDPRKLGRGASVDRADLVIVDASSYHPAHLLELNRVLASQKQPWLLVQGIYDRYGHVGPLFLNRETGCYSCLRERMRSNVAAIESFDRYEQWLESNDRYSKELSHSNETFQRHIASIVAMEAEKFLLSSELPQAYGHLLSVDPRSYRIEAHRLYAVPFCETCNPNFEYRRAPWLDAVTLAA